MNNLPSHDHEFVGRGQELAHLMELVRKGGLVTVVGLGGVGKTRLALQAAAALKALYPDGVWLVDLAAARDSDSVVMVVAKLFEHHLPAQDRLVDTLLAYLSSRQMLLILDGCESVTQGCALLATRLLGIAPRVSLLAVSREILDVPGEQVFELKPLSSSESIELFIRQIRKASPERQIAPGTLEAISRICERLDGIPLAIELAAARAQRISIESLEAQIIERLTLQRGRRTDREITLRASLKWSYDLLTAPERTLFRRLGVFFGGWTLEAVTAIGVDGELNASDVPDILASLVERSLVAFDAKANRYLMLETVRRFALELLNEAGESNNVRFRHFTFYSELAKAASDDQQPGGGSRESQIEMEPGNLRGALAWAARQPRTGVGESLSQNPPPPPLPASLSVFLCHSSGDKTRVRELYSRLCADGYSPWLDEKNILAGQDWDYEIKRAVRKSHVVAVCMSRASVDKAGYIQKEIKYALDVADEQPDGVIFIIPIKLEPCEVPDRLSRWHWVQLDDPAGYNRLVQALEERRRLLGTLNRNKP